MSEKNLKKKPLNGQSSKKDSSKSIQGINNLKKIVQFSPKNGFTSILRLQIPRIFLSHIHLNDLFSGVSRLEILNAFQYDQKNFFSLQRIEFERGTLRDMSSNDLPKFMREKFQAYYYNEIERIGDRILCIMKQKRDTGFWPVILETGPWAFLFPIIVEHDSVFINIIARESSLTDLKGILEKFVTNYEVLGQSRMKDPSDINEKGTLLTIPFPNFTDRQREIAAFAAEHGYFTSPKTISAKRIAEYFGISVSAVNENLKKAENLAMTYFFGHKTRFS